MIIAKKGPLKILPKKRIIKNQGDRKARERGEGERKRGRKGKRVIERQKGREEIED